MALKQNEAFNCMNYKNKHVWITGASSGIGEALAYALSEQGAHLILSARRLHELERVKSNCTNPEKVSLVALDLADYHQLHLTVGPVLEKLEKLDILINNAGITQRAYAQETSMKVYESLININVLGTIAMTKAVLPKMSQQKHGHIGVVTSLSGKLSTPLRTGYAASKHALHGFFDGLRAEVWQHNIDVTLICPGFVQTNIAHNALTGNGEKYKHNDDAIANGLLPKVVADKILKSLHAKKEEVNIAGKEIIGLYLKRFLPSLFSKLIRRVKVI